ncbi:hypothetical protein GM415_05845 [Pseudodesulfovibrio cashew]|uniref:Lipoprotein n=1 Tax=Pseudodesulfovibrio cashew TaxID=2678688 RepID=A0A6I6JF73_9BACT|nr:hypothetical protein [Pseudodesulfovibrio cashew]QGY39658.1 hypothetical protein GM415_05845 [Pseudodesulfovibrio cashew]
MKRLVPAILVTAVLPALSGCLLISGLLGGIGLVTTGPLQYAGTAYTVAEYSYEYAVNGRTPDEVLEAKVEFLFGEEEPPARPAPTLTAGATEVALPSLPPLAAEAEVPGPVILAETLPPPIVRKERTPLPSPAKTIAVRAMPRTTPKAAPRVPRPTRVAKSRPEPHFTYVSHRPDPLRSRLDRLEQGLAEAERIAMASPETGVRCSAGHRDAGQTGTEVSGSWSIRHPVNWTFPVSAQGVNIPRDGSLQFVSPG